MKTIKDITIDPVRSRVRIRFVEVDSRGRIIGRQQVTLDQRHFERVLDAATIVVPWNKVES